jgi:hypothetical protein
MVSSIDMINDMQAETRAAAEKRKQAIVNGPKAYVSNTIVLVGKEQRATFRPLYNMDNVIVVKMHDKYNNFKPDGSRDAIASLCAEQYGKPCSLCVNAKENKLLARPECFIPAYLYKVEMPYMGFLDEDLDTLGNPRPGATPRKMWKPVTFTNKESSEIKPVKGIRLLRAKQGSAALNALMAVFNDSDYNNDVTGCDWSLERDDSGDFVKYSCTPKPPKPMHPDLAAQIPALEKFSTRLADVYPIRVLATGDVAPQSAPQSKGVDFGAMLAGKRAASTSFVAEEDFAF